MRITGITSILFALACGAQTGPTSSSFAVTFTTESDLGLPLGGVAVSANGANVGASDEDGVVQTMLRGPDGAAVEITYTCPEGHVQPEGPQTLRLHRFRALDPEAQAGLHMLLACPPMKRQAAFIVRTGQPDVPVLLNNEVVATTNAEGVAHFHRETDPETTFHLKLDTTVNSRLRPEEPYVEFNISAHDEVFTWDQELELAPEVRRPRRPRRPRDRRPEPIVITRI